MIFSDLDIEDQLSQERRKSRREEEMLLSEAKRILNNDLFAEKKILENLKQYGKIKELITEEQVDDESVYTIDEIRKVAIKLRMKFLDSRLYKPEIPYEAILRIRHLNENYSKELAGFSILAPSAAYFETENEESALLFARTNHGNYFLIHRWGKPFAWSRKILYWPLRTFENLLVTMITFTLILALSIPTHLITLDSKAEYWSGYRGAAFFHLLIFNAGVTAYFAFAFSRNFSSTVWNRKRDFG
jgi:hypothetical protein